MEMMNYELGQARIADLKALRSARQVHANLQNTGMWESVGGWWQSITSRKEVQKAEPSYRAELMRQEWMVPSEPVQNTKC